MYFQIHITSAKKWVTGMMEQLFERTRATWVKYSEYVWREDSEGELYITAAKDAMPSFVDPMKNYEHIVVDAVNIGRMCMGQTRNAYTDEEIRDKIHAFASNYGLLGLMTGLPTTPDFLDYDYVYFPKNPIIREESMGKEEYLRRFFPFEEPNLIMDNGSSTWTIGGDVAMQALAMTMSDRPISVNMSFQREYAEPFEWLKQQFTDWAFVLLTCFLHYEEYDFLTQEQKDFQRQSVAAYSAVAPTYHLELHKHPVVVWEFHSLMLGIRMMFSFMMADEKQPLKMCRHCGMAFIASRPSAIFCSPRCKNQHNVYKSRAKKREE